MKYIPVDSYGACLHNQDMPDDVPERHATRDLTYLTRLIGQYKVGLTCLRVIIAIHDILTSKCRSSSTLP